MDSDAGMRAGNQHGGDGANTTRCYPCNDSFIRKHEVNYEEIDQESLEVVSDPKSDGEHDASMNFHDVTARPSDRWCRGQA
jgi:hypothetical protein